jgi:hypothetical protein
MQVAQRGTSTTGTTGHGYFAADRWDKGNVSLGTWTVSQETDAPDGFSNSMKYLCTTANASPASTSYLTFRQRIEGQNTQHLKFGTSSAVKLTCSFWVKSNVTGTYTLALEHDQGGGENGRTYTINAADIWEYKTITYSGQTTTAIPNNNAVGIELQFWLGTGSSFNSGTFTEDTYTTTAANRVSPSQVNLASATSNYWQITGVQLEVGDTATPFEHRSYGDELARCQRYYQQIAANNNYDFLGTGYIENGSKMRFFVRFSCDMRATPTGSSSGSYRASLGSTVDQDVTFSSFSNAGLSSARLEFTGSSLAVGEGCMLMGYSGAALKFDAEL